MSDTINLTEMLAQFSDYWAPRTVATFNGHDIRVVKVQGAFVWRRHDASDNVFLVSREGLTLLTPRGEITLGPGELRVIPRGMEYQPFAEEETHLLVGVDEPLSRLRRERLG